MKFLQSGSPTFSSNFHKLWAAQTISQFGTWLGALGLLAIFHLNATPAQMGYLETARALPVLVIGLFAGVWADRLRHQPILIWSDGGRFLLLAGTVVLAWLGQLRIVHLYITGFLVGCLAISFDVTYRSYVPALVERRKLVTANSRLSGSEVVAEIASPGLGGLLVQLIGGPLTLLADALSFLFSALLLGRIHASDPPVAAPQTVETTGASSASIWHDMSVGLQVIWRDSILRGLIIPLAIRNFFGNFYAPLYALYVIQDVGLSAALMGLTVGAGGLGALPATFLTERIAALLGVGRAMVTARFVAALIGFLVPLAAGWDAAWIGLGLLLIPQLVGDFFSTIHDILATSVRQSGAPRAMLGRVNASFEVVLGGCGTAGILVGGWLGSTVGMRYALLVAVVGILASAVMLALSPIAQLKEIGEQ